VDKVLEEVLSGDMSLATKIRYFFDRFKTERKSLAHIINDLVLDLKKMGSPYEKDLLENPYAYRFKKRKGDGYGGYRNGKITLDLDYIRCGEYPSVRDTVLHENIHQILAKSEGYSILGHPLSFFKISREVGCLMPDLYLRCNRCGEEQGVNISLDDEKNPAKFRKNPVQESRLICDCGKELISESAVVNDTVIFVNYESLLSKDLEDYIISALAHPYEGNPFCITINYGEISEFVCPVRDSESDDEENWFL
jgi:hypothetical protein